MKTGIKAARVWLWAFIPICTLVFLCGCKSTGKHVRWYSGPPRDAREIALLKVQHSVFYASALVETIDGEALRKEHWFTGNNTVEIELLPGSHTLGVAYVEGKTSSVSNAPLTATFESGHTYDLRVAQLDAGAARTMITAAFGGWGW